MKKQISSLLFCLITCDVFALGVSMNEAKTIKSDKIEYDLKSEQIKTSGNTEMTNASGQKVRLNEVTLSKNSKDVYAKDAELWLGSHVYVQAKEIKRDDNETIAKHAEFTACDGCDEYGNAWEIFSYEVIHDLEEKMLYFYSATFWLYDGNVPVLWLPYYEMPDPSVKYKTGFLTPSVNSTNGMGTQFNIPFYVNFSDTHDLTTTFSYLTNENPLFQLEHRLNLHRSKFRTNGSFTRNISNENRWHIYNDDLIELGEHARAYVYVARTSDKTYLQKYGFYDYQPYLDSGAKIELFGQTSYVIADAHIFQELRAPSGNQNTISGNILPNIRGAYQTDPIFSETYLNFYGDVLSVSGDNSSNQRFIGSASIVSPWTLWGGNRLTLSTSARYDVYNFENTSVYDGEKFVKSYYGTKSRFLPSAYVEWGLPLYSVDDDWTYIIQPRARFTVMEHTNTKFVFAENNDSAGRFLSDSTLFSSNRFSGLDVWENGNYTDYGVQWNAFNSENNIEVFLGQTYDFNKTSENFNENGFRNGFSDYVGRLSYKRHLFEFQNRFRADRDNFSLNHTENTIYFGDNANYVSLGHIWNTQPIDTFSKRDTHEAVVGAGIKLTKRLGIKGSVIYNIFEHVYQRYSGGIYYEHPCYFLAFDYNRDNAVKDDYIGGTTISFKFGISIDGKHY